MLSCNGSCAIHAALSSHPWRLGTEFPVLFCFLFIGNAVIHLESMALWRWKKQSGRFRFLPTVVTNAPYTSDIEQAKGVSKC